MIKGRYKLKPNKISRSRRIFAWLDKKQKEVPRNRVRQIVPNARGVLVSVGEKLTLMMIIRKSAAPWYVMTSNESYMRRYLELGVHTCTTAVHFRGALRGQLELKGLLASLGCETMNGSLTRVRQSMIILLANNFARVTNDICWRATISICVGADEALTQARIIAI